MADTITRRGHFREGRELSPKISAQAALSICPPHRLATLSDRES